jgi:hypothetical protein
VGQPPTSRKRGRSPIDNLLKFSDQTYAIPNRQHHALDARIAVDVFIEGDHGAVGFLLRREHAS